MNCSEIRAQARKELGNNLFCNKWLMALVLSIVYSLVLSAASLLPAIGTFIIIGPMTIGFASVILKMSREDVAADIGLMFSAGFNDFGRTLLIGLMKVIFVMLWSLLFFIPGIIKSYSYAMTEFIAADHPDWGWKECIDESRRIMNGNKWRLFVLDLSFIGWAIVCGFTCGIGTLWLTPYIYQSRCVFYRDLIGDYNVAAEYTEL